MVISAVELSFENSSLKYQNDFFVRVFANVIVAYGCYSNEKMLIFMFIEFLFRCLQIFERIRF